MSFRFFTVVGTVALTIYSFWQIPQLRDRAKNDRQVQAWIRTPDRTYATIRQCQKQVDDVNHCYNAWSAGVALAEADDGSPAGVRNKRRFKQLVEHISDADIAQEMAKACSSPRP